MKLVEKGNFDVQTEIGQMNEIGQLGRTFNMMVGQIKNLMEEIIPHQERKKKRAAAAAGANQSSFPIQYAGFDRMDG